MPKFLRPSPAMVVALVALFVALGGSALAVAKINGSILVNRSVSNIKIKKNSLTKTEVNVKALGTVPKAASANQANFAENAGELDGKQADSFQSRCADGSIKGYALVNGDTTFPSTFTSDTGNIPEQFNCASGGTVQARRVGEGNYRVLFTNSVSHVAVANSYGPGSFDEYISLNRESSSNEWEVVIHNSNGAATDHHFTIVLG